MDLFKTKPVPQSPPPSLSKGTTVQEAVKATHIFREAKGAHLVSKEVLAELREMMQPGQAENGPLVKIEGLLEAIVIKLEKLDARLSTIEQSLPALRVVSRR